MKPKFLFLLAIIAIGLCFIFRNRLKGYVSGLFGGLKSKSGDGDNPDDSDPDVPGSLSLPHDAIDQPIQSGASLAERNNNPGNLRDFGDKWQGLKGDPKSDHSFCEFESSGFGARAMVKLILNKLQSGYNTLNSLIANYAPAADGNNPVSYSHTVASALQISPDMYINSSDRALVAAIAYRMHIVEAGYPWISYNVFLQWANTL
jgi:hypothetical protein